MCMGDRLAKTKFTFHIIDIYNLLIGDSGGPLTHNGEIVGAVSWGVPCGGAAPDMFARIASFRDWFLQTIET